MLSKHQPISHEWLRSQVIGHDDCIDTPFGRRRILYADYTASGRGLAFIEEHLQHLLQRYANSHTEDDDTGAFSTALFDEAEQKIKHYLNVGEQGVLIACGSGATGAIDRMQQLVGVKLPPATRLQLMTILASVLDDRRMQALGVSLQRLQPVVFVGPYEHHSNEVSWREGLATVVEVEMTADGGVDLAHLEALLTDPRYQGRLRIGSFSAASNVTGRITPVREIARLLHRHNALAFFDYAASAPYVEIDMNPTDDPLGQLDAVFISPHKFIGGPGSCGLLVFNGRCYHPELAPSIAGGGTVDYVGPQDHDFVADTALRERAGTPPIMQLVRAAMAFEVKHAIGLEWIEQREQELLERVMIRWQANSRIEILGDPDPAKRIAIVSLNLKDSAGRYLHPRLVTRLLNDLFGIQSRAGCSCAGPYGHRLLGIDLERAEEFRRWIHKGYEGIKPGWCRVGFHYLMDDADLELILGAVEFLARYGEVLANDYRFDPLSGRWSHRRQDGGQEYAPQLDIESITRRLLTSARVGAECQGDPSWMFDQARALVEWLSGVDYDNAEMGEGVGELQHFYIPRKSLGW